MNENIISIKNLSFKYDNQSVLDDISLNISKNDFLAIIGPNGGGKSTLLKLLLGLISPNNGEIKIFNANPKINNEQIGYVPQNTNINLDFPINALDVVLMGYNRKEKVFFNHSDQNIQKAYDLLKKVGIDDVSKNKISSLSGGQRQRVMIARALFSNPSILILDEPTASIDAIGQKQIFELLKELNKTITIIVVSHDISMALDYATTIAYVNKKLSFHKSHPIDAKPFIQKFTVAGQHFCEIEMMQMLKKGLM